MNTFEKIYTKAKKVYSTEWICGYAMLRNDGTAMMYVPESRNTYCIDENSIRLSTGVKINHSQKYIFENDMVELHAASEKEKFFTKFTVHENGIVKKDSDTEKLFEKLQLDAGIIPLDLFLEMIQSVMGSYEIDVIG